jgi:hypothetical protein
MTGGLRIELRMDDGIGSEPSYDSGLPIQS